MVASQSTLPDPRAAAHASSARMDEGLNIVKSITSAVNNKDPDYDSIENNIANSTNGDWKNWVNNARIPEIASNIYTYFVYAIGIFIILLLLLYQILVNENNSINPKNYHGNSDKRNNGKPSFHTNFNDKSITLTLTNLIIFFGYLSPLLVVFFIFLLCVLSSNIGLLSFKKDGSATHDKYVWYQHNSKYINGFIYLFGIIILIFLNANAKKMLKNEQSKIKSELCNILPYPFTVINDDGNVYNTPSLGASILSFTLTYILYGLSIEEENTMIGQRWKYYSEDNTGKKDNKPVDRTKIVIPFIENKIINNITYFSKNDLKRDNIPIIKSDNYVEVTDGSKIKYYVPDNPPVITYKNKIKVIVLILFFIILNYIVQVKKLCTNNSGYFIGIILGIIVGFIYHFFTKDMVSTNIFNEFSDNLECNRVYDNNIKDTKDLKCKIYYTDASGSYTCKNGSNCKNKKEDRYYV